MEVNKFLENFKNQLADVDGISINVETKFRELDSWDSLTALSVLLMINEEYNVEISDSELRECQTVNDIFKIIIIKQL